MTMTLTRPVVAVPVVVPVVVLPAAGPRDRHLVALLMREVYRAALRARGVCTHGSAFGLSDDGEVYHPVQVGLKLDEVACAERTGGCRAVFGDAIEWMAARRAL